MLDAPYLTISMFEAERITEPSLLDNFLVTPGVSSPSTEASGGAPQPESQTRKARLVLLQPLVNAELLEACRICNDNGLLTSENEFLNIQPLSRAWRRAITSIPPFSHLIFDLTLPKETEELNDTFHQVHWDTFIPEEKSLGVPLRDVLTLVRTIATGTKIRASGDVRFEVVYEEVEGAKGIAPRAIASLKKQLLALSQQVREVKDREKGELDGKTRI
ncbi:uncharacterized protein P174DRAFT_438116 [Aspergillus novofumigatus IBT 16806]|uniref:Uncharacterized protein n=1 Tax=Aspergillus novofumigatus (strain IBT 16806) TaxID=1392255 RepID=A0A2I1CPX8_ASPN1|nr:uncharacterized protein P174DRAFT_438116 [Aspergillus novofumigatus IBT 16806]PKX99682.1 hypothetical protein P174DRAFT_438116 [Aspergillus novofumigatus IBT 16806]